MSDDLMDDEDREVCEGCGIWLNANDVAARLGCLPYCGNCCAELTESYRQGGAAIGDQDRPASPEAKP